MLGTVNVERKQLEALGALRDVAHMRAQNSVDPERLALACALIDFAALPPAERAALLGFCERLVGECLPPSSPKAGAK